MINQVIFVSCTSVALSSTESVSSLKACFSAEGQTALAEWLGSHKVE